MPLTVRGSTLEFVLTLAIAVFGLVRMPRYVVAKWDGAVLQGFSAANLVSSDFDIALDE